MKYALIFAGIVNIIVGVLPPINMYSYFNFGIAGACIALGLIQFMDDYNVRSR